MKIHQLIQSLQEADPDQEIAVHFQCLECAGTGLSDRVLPADEINPPRRATCDECDGFCWGPLITEASEDDQQ